MSQELIKSTKEKMKKSISAMQRDFGAIRAGRANPQILDRVMVDYYGTATPIAQLANVSVPEPRVLLINVWDATALSDVEKAIHSADIGIHPSNDGKAIRLVFPELTEERRKELSKTVHKRSEEGKVAVRAARRDANDAIKKLKKENAISEDEAKDLEDDIQKLTDQFIKDVEDCAKDKEKEIMEI